MSFRVVYIEGAYPLDEALHASFLEDAHEWGAESLSSIGGNLGNGGLGTLALLDEAAGDLPEFQVAGDVGRDQDVGQLAGRHEELGNQVDVPIVGTTVLLPGLLALLEVSIFLEQLHEGKGGGRGGSLLAEMSKIMIMG